MKNVKCAIEVEESFQQVPFVLLFFFFKKKKGGVLEIYKSLYLKDIYLI